MVIVVMRFHNSKGVASRLKEKYCIAECFSQHYRELFNSVYYDEKKMSPLHHDVCSETSECKDHDHCNSGDSVHEALKLVKRRKSGRYNGVII